jgi:hypothetical protein
MVVWNWQGCMETGGGTNFGINQRKVGIMRLTNEQFVKSVYPNATIQWTPSATRLRVVSEPTINGRWLGTPFSPDAKLRWKAAAKAVRKEMLRKLES